MYDYLIVGSGLFGSVFAHEAAQKGYKCIVIDKRDHIGGNVYTEKIEGINVHRYGAHIFHTSDKAVWEYINRFTTFNRYTNCPVAKYKGNIYNLPFNMNTFSKMWNITTPAEAKDIINGQIAASGIKDPKNLEEQAISLVGKDIYNILIKGYTEKQWGCDCTDLPPFIIKRLPVRFTYDNNYFNDDYQGIPIGGYTEIIEKLLDGIEVMTSTEYKDIKDKIKAKKTVYTGTIDSFFDFSLGKLEYRTLRFETEIIDTDNYQGNAVVNYTEREIPYTRIIEHKHFENSKSDKTVITKEYPSKWNIGDEPYYPVNNDENNALYEKYLKLAENTPEIIFGGRLGQYKYFDMDKTIKNALELADKEL